MKGSQGEIVTWLEIALEIAKKTFNGPIGGLPLGSGHGARVIDQQDHFAGTALCRWPLDRWGNQGQEIELFCRLIKIRIDR